MALTPVLDGSLSNEEWQPFGKDTYLQWEPGVVYFAAVVSDGDDLVIDLDPDGDGWLNGVDNTELRISSGSKVAARTLDTTPRSGPVWKSKSASNVSVFTTAQDGRWIVEGRITLDSSKTIKEGSVIGIDMETMPSGASTGPAFLPRSLAYRTLGFDSAENLPDGMEWHSSTKLREVAKEDQLRMDFDISGKSDFTSYKLHAEGWAQNMMASVAKPFPGFDRNGHASLQYRSDIASGATAGWRILNASILDADGKEHVLRTSFKIADLIELEVSLPDRIKFSADGQTLKGRVDVRSMGVGRVEGEYAILAPQTWQVVKGGPQRILIFNPRSREPINLEFTLPPGATGDYPITFTVNVGNMAFTKTVVVNVSPPGS